MKTKQITQIVSLLFCLSGSVYPVDKKDIKTGYKILDKINSIHLEFATKTIIRKCKR
jgi:hypothetical protein